MSPVQKICNHLYAVTLSLLLVWITSASPLVTRDTFKAQDISAVPNTDWSKLHPGGVNQPSAVPSVEPQSQNVPPYPGSRRGVSYWADHHGQLWMMGGWGYDESTSTSRKPSFLNDLWIYDSARDKWKCLRNSDKSSSPDGPSARHLGASCGLHATGFVIFGGAGFRSRTYNDTWIYEINNATWIQIVDSVQNPARRSDVAYWCVRDGLIIFGGQDEKHRALSDMWRFSFENLEWEKLEQKSAGQDGAPASRHGASAWSVGRDKLFMYGGHNKIGYLSDMWVYSVKNQTWTRVHRNSSHGGKSEVGTLGIASPEVSPKPSAHHATWVDAKSNLILFGGESPSLLPDLWQFNTATLQWMWLGRASLPVYKQSKNAKNFPSARSLSMSWSFRNVMYLFGGYVLDLQNNTALLNDMFVLTKDNVTYVFSTDDKWLHLMPASTVFIIILSTFTGIALTVGAGFFIKKTLDYPRHKTGEFDVRYSPLAQETTLEM